jgi:hypothetical protein
VITNAIPYRCGMALFIGNTAGKPIENGTITKAIPNNGCAALLLIR